MIQETPTAPYKRTVLDEISHFLGAGDIFIIHGAGQVGKISILMYVQDQLLSYMEKAMGSSPLAKHP